MVGLLSAASLAHCQWMQKHTSLSTETETETNWATHCLSLQNWSFNLTWHLPASVWLSVIRPQCLIVCWSTVDYDYNLSSSPIQASSTNPTVHLTSHQLSPQLFWFGWFNSCISFNKSKSYKQSYVIQLMQFFLKILSVLIEFMQLCNPS